MNKELKQKEYWNNKWEKRSITYAGRTFSGQTIPIDADVRTFIFSNDSLLKKIIKKYDLKKSTYNETAHACQKFVIDFMSYETDLKHNGVYDFWQFPFESIACRIGDCEDGAILMASLMINAGIPNWRVRVACGYIKPNVKKIGHSWCIYLADKDNGKLDWEIHDWCMFEDSSVPSGKKLLASKGGYKSIYTDMLFSFNDEFAWSNEITKIEGRMKNMGV